MRKSASIQRRTGIGRNPANFTARRLYGSVLGERAFQSLSHFCKNRFLESIDRLRLSKRRLHFESKYSSIPAPQYPLPRRRRAHAGSVALAQAELRLAQADLAAEDAQAPPASRSDTAPNSKFRCSCRRKTNRCVNIGTDISSLCGKAILVVLGFPSSHVARKKRSNMLQNPRGTDQKLTHTILYFYLAGRLLCRPQQTLQYRESIYFRRSY